MFCPSVRGIHYRLESEDLRIFGVSKVVPFYSATDKLLTLKNGFDGRQEVTSGTCLEDISLHSVAQNRPY